MATLDAIKALSDQSQSAQQANLNLPPIPERTLPALAAPIIKSPKSFGSPVSSDAVRSLNAGVQLGSISKVPSLITGISSAPKGAIDPTVNQQPQPSAFERFVSSPLKWLGGEAVGALNYASAGLTAPLTELSVPVAAAIEKIKGGSSVSYLDALSASQKSQNQLISGIAQGHPLAEQLGITDWINNSAKSLMGDTTGSKLIGGALGFGAILALDPTSYLGGAGVEKLIAESGVAELSKFGLSAYKSAVSDGVRAALEVSGEQALDAEKIIEIQNNVANDFVKAAQAGGKDARFTKGGVRVLGTDFVLPGTPQLTGAMKATYDTVKELVNYIPGVEKTASIAKNVISKFSAPATLIAKVDEYLGRVVDEERNVVAASDGLSRKFVEDISGRKIGQANQFWDNIGQYSSQQDFKQALLSASKTEAKDAASLTDAEVAMIAAFRGDKEVYASLRPFAKDAADKIYQELDVRLAREAKAGVPEEFSVLRNYFPQAPAGKTEMEIKMQAQEQRSLLQTKIDTNTATEAERQAYNDLGIIIQSKGDKTPWFMMNRTFSDPFSMAAAGFTPTEPLEILSRRLVNSDEFLSQRRVVQKVFDKYGKVVQENAGKAVEEAAIIKAAAEKQAYTDAVKAGKQYEPHTLPRDLRNAKPNYSFGNKHFTVSFSNDVDKAAYIIAQLNGSKRDVEYLQFVMDALGVSEKGAWEYGNKVKAAIKDIAKTAEGETISLSSQLPQGYKGVEKALPRSAEQIMQSDQEARAVNQLKPGQFHDEVTGTIYELPGHMVKILNDFTDRGGGTYISPTLRRLLKPVGYATRVYKVALTAAFPAFYVRNTFAAMFNTMLSQGLYMSMKPGLLGDAWALTEKTFPKELAGKIVNYGGIQYNLQDLHKWLWKNNLFLTQEKNDLPGWFRSLYTHLPGNPGERSETIPRAISFLMGVESSGHLPGALAQTKKIMYDYSNMSQFEKDVMQLVVPFYGYHRQNINYWADLIAHQPKTFANVHRAYQYAEKLAYQDNQNLVNAYVPDYIKRGYFLPLGSDGDGNINFLNELGLSIEPFNADTQIFSSNGIQGILSNMNPLIKLPVEAFSGQSLYTGDKITPNDARSQAGLLREWNRVTPGFVQYAEKTVPDPKAPGGVKKYYSANPTAIAIVANLPTSRFSQLLNDIFERQDKSAEHNLLKGFTGINIQTINPQTQAYFSNLNQAQTLRDVLVNLGVIKQATNGKYYIDTKATINGDAQYTSSLRLQAQNVLNYIHNPSAGVPTDIENGLSY